MPSRTFQATGRSPDPYELDRLAEELVAREQAGASQSATSTELPIYVPLSHDNPHLTADVFNVEEFLLSRSHTSLHDLRSELRDYLSSLKEELVLLINDDYEAFISLSTDLRGEGLTLEKLKLPLDDLRKRISVSIRAKQVIVPLTPHARIHELASKLRRTLFKRHSMPAPSYAKRKFVLHRQSKLQLRFLSPGNSTSLA